MSRWITVRIPDDLARALAARARRTGEQASALVRAALSAFLDVPHRARARPIDRVRALVGSVVSGDPDLADSHREAVLESLGNGR